MIICPINNHLDLFLVFLLDIVVRVFVAWIRKPTEFLCLAMFSFLRIISPMITPLFLLWLTLITDSCDSFVPTDSSFPISVTPSLSSASTSCVPCADSIPLNRTLSAFFVWTTLGNSFTCFFCHCPTAYLYSPHDYLCSRWYIINKTHIINSLCAFTAPLWCQVHLAVKEPRGFKSAVKHTTWLSAVDDEIITLKHKNTWQLVPRPANHNVMGCRWIFKTKLHADDTDPFSIHKARLMQGFSQKHGTDFDKNSLLKQSN